MPWSPRSWAAPISRWGVRGRGRPPVAGSPSDGCVRTLPASQACRGQTAAAVTASATQPAAALPHSPITRPPRPPPPTPHTHAPPQVVDVGGGTGFCTLGIVRSVSPSNVTLMDQSPHQLAKARAKPGLKGVTILEVRVCVCVCVCVWMHDLLQ